MKYTIKYTESAKQDVRNIYGYISQALHEPETAAKQVRRILKEVRSLEERPRRYRLYEDEPWHSRGLRFFPVKHYLVFYIPDEETHVVNILRVMYGGRDIEKQWNK